jgi:hypothetical protein
MFKHWSASSLWFLSPRLWDAERDSPHPAPTLTRVAPRFIAYFIDRRDVREQDSLVAVPGAWTTRRSDHWLQMRAWFRFAPRTFVNLKLETHQEIQPCVNLCSRFSP